MHRVELKNVSKSIGPTDILSDVNLKVADGEFLVLVGPSGCGKSTLLKLIAGLQEVTSGEILLENRVINHVDPKDRDIAMVFQSYALYPHMSVFENMAFGLRVRKMPAQEIKRRVEEAAELLQLTKLLERKPKQLSGGQCQRVALGRAIVRKPKVFLFDEPLSNLDAKLRNQMRIEIKKLHQLLGTTMIYVTHDQVEATTMGDRIVILDHGQIQQVDTPVSLYQNPSNQFVAGFIGVPEINFISGKIGRENANWFFNFGEQRLPLDLTDTYEGPLEVILGVRPESLKVLLQPPAGHAPVLTAELEIIENLGSQTLIHSRINGAPLRAVGPFNFKPDVRGPLFVEFDASKIYLFDRKSGVNLLSPEPVSK